HTPTTTTYTLSLHDALPIFEPFELPLPRKLSSRSVIYFPGSTIGNFEPATASEFLSRLVELAGDGGGLLIGVDLQKDRHLLERRSEEHTSELQSRSDLVCRL